MANPQAEGRMIRRTVSNSPKFAALSPEAAVLFMMIIPWFNAHGKLNGGPGYIKDEICPKIPYLTYQNIPALLKEINDKTNVKWFQFDDRYWLHSLHFNTEHQTLKSDKMGSDKLPSYTPELLQNYSGTSSDLVPHEEEEEVEVEVEAKGKSETENKEKTAFMDNLKTALEKTKARYPSQRDQQAILVFVQANIQHRNPDAILHCINSIIKAPGIVKFIPKYLDAALKIEDGKYNAADSERRCNEFKKMDLGAFDSMVSNIGQGM